MQTRLFHNKVGISIKVITISPNRIYLQRDRQNLRNVKQLHQNNRILPFASDRYTWSSGDVKTVVDSGENQSEDGNLRILYA